jgi:hypothetical protein
MRRLKRGTGRVSRSATIRSACSAEEAAPTCRRYRTLRRKCLVRKRGPKLRFRQSTQNTHRLTVSDRGASQARSHPTVSVPGDVGAYGPAAARSVTKWLGGESNSRHEDFQSSALPTELPSRLTGSGQYESPAPRRKRKIGRGHHLASGILFG